MIVESHNEWDPLKTVVLGSVLGARFPKYDDVFNEVAKHSKWTETSQPVGPINQDVIDLTDHELRKFEEILTSLGVEVLRPRQLDFQQTVHGYRYFADGFYNYCPRDVILVVGNTVIETPVLFHS